MGLGVIGSLLVIGRLPVVSAGVVAGAAARQVSRGHEKANRETAGQDKAADPNAACAGCHRAIYERYRKTPMANASGAAADGFLPGGLTHAASGITYKMEDRDGRVSLAYERPGVPGQVGGDDRALKGQVELKYFLGSGLRGRTYLFEREGYWFEIPINWYAKKGVWDMAPNYLEATEMPLTLEVDPGCLRCHMSGAQPSLPEARNKYAGAPFLEGGITCTACHGDAAAHVASGGKTAMLKIGALAPVKRDSVCLGCHLEGEQAVVHRGKRLVDFRPGDNLFDYASYFVRRAGGVSGGPGGNVGADAQKEARATSQWEALLTSGCKRGAGSALTCTSCHDPHDSTRGMTAAERIGFYREKCLACHDADAAAKAGAGLASARAGFAATHHPEKPDCAGCHMPRAKADDIAHEQVTDHSIPRIASAAAMAKPTGSVAGRLVAIGSEPGVPGASTDRDLGLAYAFAASRGDRAAGERAMELLRQAEKDLPAESGGDAALHEQLGFLDQLAGDAAGAAKEYGLALEADGHDSVAAGNLALLKAGEKQYGAAISLWERAFGEDPVQLKAGMNLALVECGVGRKEAALGTLDRLLEFSPDDGAARELARGIRSGSHGCRAR